MNKEDLIKKWLNYELSPEEQQAFQKLDDYDDLIKMSSALNTFKAPRLDQDTIFSGITAKLTSQKAPIVKWPKLFSAAAAIALLVIGTYYYTWSLETTFTTGVSEKQELVLPDHSIANLNAQSQVTFNKKKWPQNRLITLKGEAFFKVTKGSSFTVSTNLGDVTVLGTEFNVKQRGLYFEVICYEGSVKVTHQNDDTILKPGESFLIRDGHKILREPITYKEPFWIRNISAFQSVPLRDVLLEFERQYDMTVDAKKIDTSILFTGKFTHDNINIALQSISEPINLTYTITKTKIILMRE